MINIFGGWLTAGFGQLGQLHEWWSINRIKGGFGIKARIEFYRSLSMLLRNGTKLETALWKMYGVISDDGKKITRPVAIILFECHNAVSTGKTLSSVLHRYAPQQEASLIEAGEKSGTLFVPEAERRLGRKGAFEFAIDVAKAGMRLRGAVGKAFAYPIVLVAMAAVVLNIVSERLVPSMAKASDPSTWTGSGKTLYLLAETTTNYGIMIAIIIASVIALVIWSLPKWCGSLRFYADKALPWSMYRMIYGATFLMNVAVLVRSGVMLNDALALLSARANPWLKERIEAAMIGTASGTDLGTALYNGGYDFPDRRAVQYMMILGSNEGAEESMEDFGREWLEESVGRIEAMSGAILVSGIAAIGMLMILVIVGSASITDAMQAQYS